jgi:PKD repeat protein
VVRCRRIRPAIDQLERRDLLSASIAITGMPRTGHSPEGTAVLLGSAITGAVRGETFQYAWQVLDNGTPYATGSASRLSFTPNDNGAYVVNLTATDQNGASVTASRSLIVDNVAPHPKITLAGADAGIAAVFSVSAIDPSTVDTAAGFTYAWTFGDTTTGSGPSLSHTYAKPGTYRITVSATDKDGGVGTTSLFITVAALPTAMLRAPSVVREGSTTTRVTFTSARGGGGGYTFSYDFDNDGIFEVVGSHAASAVVPESYLDDGPAQRVVHARITDGRGGYTDHYVTVNIINVAPTPIIRLPVGADIAVAEPFVASAADPSKADVAAGFTYSWSFGDGSAVVTGANPTHAFLKTGVYKVKLSATDKNGSVGTTIRYIVVTPLPTAKFTDPPVNEGTTTATVAFSRVAGGSGGYFYSYDFDNNGTFEITGSRSALAVVPESYVDDAGTLVVHGRITDGAGGFSDYTTTLTIADVAPTPRITLPSAVDAGLVATFGASATSPSTSDVSAGFTFSWNFGDGTSPVTGANPSHTFARPGTYTVTLTATDADGGTASGTTTASIIAKGPVSAAFTGTASAAEGSTSAAVRFASPAGGSGGYTYSYDFNNDGTFEIASTTSATAIVPESYVDDGPATVVVHGRITDSLGESADYTTTIAVTNVAPTPSITLPSAADATVLASFAASATDPSTSDTSAGFTYGWNFGDGTSPVSGANVNHVFANAGTYTVALSATDKDGGVGTKTASFAVAPLPSATFTGPSSVPEGSTNATATFTNATGGSGGYTYSYDFNNDGNFDVTGGNASATIPESYFDDGPSTRVVHGRITDSLGGYTDYTTSITVTNAAPTATITLPSATDATIAVPFAASATDPSAADTGAGFTYAWNFGDGTGPAAGASVSHAFAAAGTYTITLTATDKDGGVGTTTAHYTVAALPSASFSGPSSVTEGTTTAKVTFANPAGGTGGYTYSYDFNNDGTFEVTGSSASANIPESYFDDGPSTRVVHGRITDGLGGYTDYTTSITVTNVAPTPTITLPSATDATIAVPFTGSATDPSTADTGAGFTYAWNFGDGTGPAAGASVSHAFATADTYTITLTATDKDGGVGTTTAHYTVAALPSASFSGPSSVTEGTASAKVTFANPTGGTGGYTYSYDFNNDGTFEITGSSSASATLPESYVDDAGTLVVHGRITDSLGGFTNYTTSVTITDVAPTPTFTPPSSPIAGAAATFTASATSPSTADTRAGFAFSWNFGDGSGGSGANVSHTYAAPGNYTVTVTATDADGGTATGTTSTTITVYSGSGDYDPYIITPYLKIPNFGAHPTIVSIVSGNWSNPATWSLGRVPQAGDVVDINPGFTVTYDVNDATDAIALNTVEVQPTATLTFRTDISTQICVANFMVLQGGNLIVGTAANPIAANVNCNIDIANQAINTSTDPEQFGTGLIVLGNVTMHGAAKVPYVTLAQEAHAGNTVLHLAAPATGWQVGDDLVLPDTRQLDYGGDGGSYSPQWEQLNIKSMSADGLTVTLSAALKYNHLGGYTANGVLTYLPQVMNDDRNIMVESQSMTGTRGYTLFTNRANVDIEYAGFCELGRTVSAAPDNTTFNSNGTVKHVGTNEEDRYAMTALDLIGPTTPQSNGYQYTFIGDSVDNDGDGNASNPKNIQWGLAVNNSFYGLIQSNVVYAVAGSAIGVEDGASSYNRFDSNFVIDVTGTATRGDQALQGVAFWFANPNNYITNNIAADINGNAGDVFSYGYSIDVTGGEYSSDIGGATSERVPLAQGDDPSVSGQYKTMNMNDTPLLSFSGDAVYGASSSGMTLWWIGTFGDTFYSDAQTSTVQSFVAWNIGTRAIYGYPINNVVIDSATILGDTSYASNGYNYSQGINFDDYMTHNLVIQNCNIQGMSTGIEAPFMVGRVAAMDTTVIQNCNLDNTVNIDLTPPRSVNGSTGLSPQTLDIISCTFSHPSEAPSTWWFDISMDYLTSDSLGTSNMHIAQYVYVTNYNDIQGDNFQVFYTQSNSPTGTPPSGAHTMALIDGLVLAD